MKAQFRSMLVIFLALTILTGVLYPLAVTGIAQAAFPSQANGSLLLRDGQPIGSGLIGQNFTSDRYFWGRPSSTAGHAYNALDLENLSGSTGSNLGPLSEKLVEAVKQRVQVLDTANPDASTAIPVDLVTSSASGLDPEISVQAALFQIPRIAKARGLSQSDIQKLVEQSIAPRQFGFLGEERVNVLKLNLALDGLQ